MEFQFWIIFLDLLALLVQAGDEVMKPRIDCPVYVHEGHDLECECKAPAPDMEGYTIFWQPYRRKRDPVLTLANVNRRDNGSTYDCRMAWRSQLFKSSYTLQVAYGPSAQAMKIEGPSHFVTDGSRNLSLKCIVREVNPSPVITLFEPSCGHGEETAVCSFQPKPVIHQHMNVTCEARNVETGMRAVTTYRLRLKYPPVTPPVIIRHTDESSDNLSCTVFGGEPVVSKVIFSCTNPSHEDQQDVHEKYLVSSTLTLASAKSVNNDKETVCTCIAVWGPEPGLYSLNASVVLALRISDKPAVQNRNDELSSPVVIASVCAIIICASIIGLVVFLKKRREQSVQEDLVEEHTGQAVEPLQSATEKPNTPEEHTGQARKLLKSAEDAQTCTQAESADEEDISLRVVVQHGVSETAYKTQLLLEQQ